MSWTPKRIILLSRWLLIAIMAGLMISAQGLRMFWLILLYILSNLFLASKSASVFDHNGFNLTLFCFDTIMICLVIYFINGASLSRLTLFFIIAPYFGYSFIFMRQRLKAFHHLSERYEIVLSNLHEMIFSFDRQDGFSFITLNCEQILGQPDHALMHNPESFYSRIYREDQKKVMTCMNKLLKKPGQGSCEFRIHHPKNGVRWLQMNYAPMTEKSGHHSGIQGSLRDISDHKEIQNALFQSGLPSSMGKLALIMTLEMTNPLQIIKNVVYSLRKHKDLQAQKKSLDMIKEGESRIENIIQKMVEISQFGASQTVPVDLHQLLQKAVSATKNRMTYKRIHIKFSFSPEDVFVLANPNRLFGAFLNIILNAIEAMDNGGQISVSTNKKRGRMEVRFMDSGHGIPSETLDHIFEPFYTTKNKINALGLGLTISQWIIHDIGGEIQAQSMKGHGTTMILTLPIYRVSKASQKTKGINVPEVCHV